VNDGKKYYAVISMEEDIQRRQVSPLAEETSERINERLQEAIEKANNRINYESAHNEELLLALSVVRDFIGRKKRICYGGTAMNSILPENRRFYDPETDLPDYDFYTPDVEKDVEELVGDLEKAGFKDIYHKVGMHAGTKKILVNYVAVADISEISPELFAIMYRRSIVDNGIHYTDPDILRMMMYLEISRPRGEVDRWTKVFERLQLINQEFPIKAGCARSGEKRQKYTKIIPTDIRKTILTYCIENQRILCNGPLMTIYSNGIRRGKVQFNIGPGGPLLFTSPDPKTDAVALRNIINNDRIKLYLHPERGELVPLRIELRMGDDPICMFVEETACHSFNSVELPDKRKMPIASLEFLITLYLSINIFTNHSADYLGERIMCQVKKFISLAHENYKATRSLFPAFSLKCRGHQVGYASLLKAKVQRIKAEKEKQTRRVKRKKKAKTKKASK
jgi:hypothetical protein